ncbi:AAA family ATPase [Bradyrhizobium sp. SZCCHNS3002]|uniref:AAA family ATPase n=1 Tax=Bradyrhizobium sp. SZCCHNS3002 TaxID=3057310 RepID=UPI0028EEC391|nr:AAA family ATPase [Bradyrhizobium sp. SZCCHNS3002]
MRFDPTLIVKRLVVERNGRSAYDEMFHEGVNVVRGENSSGKSTILNFIFYGLGGDLSDWSETALLCSRVLLEVELNGKLATLSRDISSTAGQGMEIFGGDYESSLIAPRADWIRYPYRRSPSQESFSQAIFRLLGIPEVAMDVSGNITINQILRLLYSDQLSPVEELFRHDSRFDSPALRDAVGRLLAGAYESALYDNEIKLREMTREFDAKNAELRSLFAVLGHSGHNLTVDWLEAQRRSLEEERLALHSEIEVSERKLYASAADDQLTLTAQNDVYRLVQELQSRLGKARQERDALMLSVADSAAFINSLEQKLAALNDSSLAAQHLGDVTFSVCPACYAPLDAKESGTHHCHLCKTPFDGEHGRGRIVTLINDTALQLKQSRLLQGKRTERIAKTEVDLRELEAQWRGASERLSSLQRLPSSEAREELRSLQRRLGYLDRQIEDLSEKARIIHVIDEISARKNELNDAMNQLKTLADKLRFSQQRRLEQAYTEIADEVRTLLRHDLRRQDTFETANNIQFDFSTNKISVDGHSYFSASSRVILKSSFVLGFFAAATKDPAFRHPRFVMIDTTEDKGMEPERSHNFQNQILRVSQESKVQHQVIYATAMISPDLDDEDYTVGKFSTRDDATLAID